MAPIGADFFGEGLFVPDVVPLLPPVLLLLSRDSYAPLLSDKPANETHPEVIKNLPYERSNLSVSGPVYWMVMV